MGPTSDEHNVRIEGHEVSVRGGQDPDHATWTLSIDGQPVDHGEAATGDFTLRGRLGDGSEVEAFIHRSVVGPTQISIRHAGDDVSMSRDFAA